MAINPTPNNNIIDLDLSVTSKKQFRINGDDDRILELNTSDMGIIARVTDFYPKLKELQNRATDLMSGIDEEALESEDLDTSIPVLATVAERLKAIDQEMRDMIDQVFDAPVSEICAPDGSMYDPFNGNFRFEYIINLLMSQYEGNLNAEYKKVQAQMAKHTGKYKKG